MKKSGIINQPLATAIAGLGHLDMVVIADAGLPIPDGPRRIDLALSAGIPSFLDTLRVVLSEMCVERAIIAEEMLLRSPALRAELLRLLGDGVAIQSVPHEHFKWKTAEARAIVRTGEFSPFANVALVSGVTF